MSMLHVQNPSHLGHYGGGMMYYAPLCQPHQHGLPASSWDPRCLPYRKQECYQGELEEIKSGSKVGNMQLLLLSCDVSIFPGWEVNFGEQVERANIHSMSIYLLYL